MGITRRSVLGVMGAGALFAQAPIGGFKLGYRGESEGTRIAIFDGENGAWMVGLNSNEAADTANVEVFYEVAAPEGILRPGSMLLLHRSSPCPVVQGNKGMGATDQNFTVPLADVRFIRVTLLKTVAAREFR